MKTAEAEIDLNIQRLKSIRSYFGEHDVSAAEHRHFFEADEVIKFLESYASQQSTEVKTKGAEVKQIIKFINEMKITQTLLNGNDIETVHIPSLLHKCQELASQSLPQQPVSAGTFVNAKDRLPEKSGYYYVKIGIDKILWTRSRLIARVNALKRENIECEIFWLDESATPQPTGGMQEVIDFINPLKKEVLQSYQSKDVQDSEKLQSMYEGMNLAYGMILGKIDKILNH
jgi:hypothetical protein